MTITLGKKLLKYNEFFSVMDDTRISNKGVQIGQYIICPCCRKVFRKDCTARVYCSTKCKDTFWELNKCLKNKESFDVCYV